ncbi:MAG: hypothetical protein JW951_10660 [Lentisphaerae bacterium]|nr:hypothetical protein [Lentisphaerota bacterium]
MERCVNANGIAPSPDLPPPPAPKRVPAGAHAVAWMLVLLAWGALAWHLLHHPLPGRQAEEAAPPPPPAPVVPPAARTAVPEPERILRLLKQEVVACLFNHDVRRAVALIDEALRDHLPDALRAEAQQMRDILQALPSVNLAVADAFRSRIGERITLHVGDRTYDVELRAISGEKVNVLVYTPGTPDAEPKPVTFSVADLDPAEKSRWLGPGSDPGISLLKCLLSVEAGNPDFARMAAARTGPLADALLEQIE